MEYLTTVDDLRTCGRPLGKVDDKQLLAFVTEAEQLMVKPVLGDALLIDIKNEGEDKYKTLLSGGTYEDGTGAKRAFAGLRAAVAYYVYAQNIMVGDFQSTRYGIVMKDNDYSQHLSSKDRSNAYNNALEVAHGYLRDCIRYCKAMGYIMTSGNAAYNGATRIRKIG